MLGGQSRARTRRKGPTAAIMKYNNTTACAWVLIEVCETGSVPSGFVVLVSHFPPP